MSIEKPEVVMLPIEKIKPNDWNPNVMAAQDFNDLVDNVDELGFVQPVVVVPIDDDGEGHEFLVVDGEHRFEGLRLLDEEEIPCVIVDKIKGNKYAQQKQTVRLNKIKGKMDKRKLAALVTDMMTERSFDTVAEDLLFHDPTEMEELLNAARESLPTDEMREAFDRARDDIKTVDDLSLVLNKLFTTYGDTLPANFMILDFGGRQHTWIRMDAKSHKMVVAAGRDCIGEGYTFDSVIKRMMMLLDVPSFVQEHARFLEEVSVAEPEAIDDLMGPENEDAT